MKKLKALIAGAFLALFVAAIFAPTQAHAVATTINSTKILRQGVSPTTSVVDVTNGMLIPLTGDTIVLRFYNPGSTTSTTVTARDQLASNVGYQTDATCGVHAAGVRYMGPFKKSRWGNSGGNLVLDFSGNTNTTIEVLKLPIGEPESQTK